MNFSLTSRLPAVDGTYVNCVCKTRAYGCKTGGVETPVPERKASTLFSHITLPCSQNVSTMQNVLENNTPWFVPNITIVVGVVRNHLDVQVATELPHPYLRTRLLVHQVFIQGECVYPRERTHE